MNPSSNTGSNTAACLPDAATMIRLKTEHKISWHPKGGWCRKFPGDANRTYFGKVSPAAAIKIMHSEEQRRERGEQPVTNLGNMPLRKAVNAWLTYLDGKLATGKISQSHRARCGREIDTFIRTVGVNRRLSDFCKRDAPELLFRKLRSDAWSRGLGAAAKHIKVVREFLKWCSSTQRYIPAPFYAEEFTPPTDKERKNVKDEEVRHNGVATWSSAQVREIVGAAKADSVHRYAQVLLMLNGGMGSKDLSMLRDDEVIYDERCIRTTRSKTQVPRIIPLWPETIDAMKASRSQRPQPSDPEYANLFFLTEHGRPLVVERMSEDRRKHQRTDAVKNWFYTLLNGDDRKKWKRPAVRLRHLKRHRAGGYTLRSVFATFATGDGIDPDHRAIVMGHLIGHKPTEGYLRGVTPDLLRYVVDRVHVQIWPPVITG